MFNVIDKISTNISGKQKKKKQIILTHTGRDIEEYLMSLKYRMNGKFNRVPHYIISKNGDIIQTLPNEAYSDYFKEPNVNRNSIIISFENLGWLEKVPLKDYYTNWISNIYKGVPYEKKWRDYFFWDPYTEEQINATVELVDSLFQKNKIKRNIVGHNTKLSGVERYEGLTSKSNYDSIYTDVNPSFNFEEFIKKIDNDE